MTSMIGKETRHLMMQRIRFLSSRHILTSLRGNKPHIHSQIITNQTDGLSHSRKFFSTSGDANIAKVLDMPSLSPTMTQGTIASWKKQPGDKLVAGDLLCEIETDKASVGFEVQDDCVLAKILVEAQGKEVPVGTPIALLVDDDDAFIKYIADASKISSDALSTVASISISTCDSEVNTLATEARRLSPAARHLVESKLLDISKIRGTSKGGLVSKADVILGLKSGVVVASIAGNTKIPTSSVLTVDPIPSPSSLQNSTKPASEATFNHRPAFIPVAVTANENFADIPNSNMRKVIAKRLTESKASVPHFYASIECEIDSLMRLRKDLKKDFDVNVSVNDLVVKSAALALRDVPEANAKWSTSQKCIVDGAGVVDISIAVATPTGLITPIVTGVDRRGIADINATVKDLAGRARDGKLKPLEYQGGSFSISNLGMFGISSFSAVINPPQACILAVGSGVTKLRPSQGKLKLVTSVTVQLSADRRVVDESTASTFLQVFQKYLSNPKIMIL